jgi:molecular chaperone DnaJ
VTLKIPAETQTGKSFRIRGKGIKGVRGSATGDLVCRVHGETPVKLTDEQRELLSKLDESLIKGGDKHSPKKGSWFGKVKKFFKE